MPHASTVQLSHASNCRMRPIVARPGCGDQFSRVQFSASNCRDTLLLVRPKKVNKISCVVIFNVVFQFLIL
jgi:hypothetical protein